MTPRPVTPGPVTPGSVTVVPDSAWLPVLQRRLRAQVRVVGRAEAAGGYATGGVQRVDLDVGGVERAVVVKPAGAAEVSALRAVAVVPGVDAPTLLAAGPGWVVLPWYPGRVATGPVPERVLATLARVHAHWLANRPRAIPVADGAWWRALCARVRPALLAAGTRTGEGVFGEVADAVAAWADDPRALAAAAGTRRTLVHGDPHRGNVLVEGDDAVLIDWGNALVAPAAFDLTVLRAEGTLDLTAYTDLFAQLTGTTPSPAQVTAERCWAELAVPVRYLGFAADHLGAGRVAELAGMSERALTALP